MRRTGTTIAIIAAALLCSCHAGAGDLYITGGNVSLQISSAAAGQEPDPAVDSSSGLSYRRGSSDPVCKIVVSTNLGSPLYALTVEAANSASGIPTGEVTLSTSDQDLVTFITRRAVYRSCDLIYRATAQVCKGVGQDSHTVTYTITAN